MEYFAALCAMALCVFFFVRVWRLNNKGTTIITPFLLFAVMEMVLNWPAAFLAPVYGEARDLLPLLLVLLGFISFLVGSLIGGQLIRHRSTDALEYNAQPIESYQPRAYLFGVSVLFVLLCWVGYQFYEGMPPVIGSLETLLAGGYEFDSAAALAQNRRLLTKDHYFGGEYRGQGLLRVILRIGWPFITAIALTALAYSKKRMWLLIAVTSFVATFVYVAGEGTRAPFLFSLVFLVVLVSMIRKLRYRTIAFGALAFLGLMIGLSLISPKLQWALSVENPFVVIFDHVATRIFMGNGLNSVHIVELVRDGSWHYSLGEVHLQRLMTAIPGINWGTPLSHQLYLALNPFGNNTTYASATYFGDVFIDFGSVGVIVVYFYLGLLVVMVQKVLFSIPRTVQNIPMIAYLVFLVGFIPLSGVVGVIAALPVLAVVYGIPHVVSRTLQKSRLIRRGRRIVVVHPSGV